MRNVTPWHHHFSFPFHKVHIFEDDGVARKKAVIAIMQYIIKYRLFVFLVSDNHPVIWFFEQYIFMAKVILRRHIFISHQH